MSIKHLFYLLLALPLLAVACEQNKPDVDTPVDFETVLALTSKAEMAFEAEGGEGVITYTAELREITRTEDSPAPEATCEAEWITLGSADFDDCTFTVAANEGEERKAKIVVTYGDKSIEVTVSQAKHDGGSKEQEVIFTLTSESAVEYGAEGGEGKIEYTIEWQDVSRNDPSVPEAKCEAKWISLGLPDLDFCEFFVMANDGEEREAKIIITYWDKSIEVTVKQAAKEINEEPEVVEFTATYFDGEYYGDYYSEGIGNYYLHLSDNGFQESGNANPNSTYYRIDLYSDYYDGEQVESLQLPYGTYTLDLENKFEHGTFSVEWSKLLCSDGEGNFVVEKAFEAGELVVDESGATLKVTIEGKQHVVTYNGATLVADKRTSTGEDVGGGGEDDEPKLSTLTGDYSTQLDKHMLIYANYGDYYATGLNNWTFAIWPNDYEGDHIQFDIMNESADSFLGTYTIGDENTANSFFKGYIEGDGEVGYMRGSWYYTDDGVTMAPFVDGELRITNAGGSYIKVDFTVVDDKGNKIIGSWKGAPQELQ